jgi:pyruvate-formate lyase-activating enzyme
VEIRIPLIPDYNDGAAEGIGALLAKYRNITKVRVLKYHNMAQSKYASLGNDHTLPALSEDDRVDKVCEILRGYGLTVIK